ncbi:MAG: cation:dicarboxylase symporter family transporter [Alphaproteobacteria bacterium]|nr:cation:dicarboxylase symporter family transporter [Alphaproteobacteria bacterium]
MKQQNIAYRILNNKLSYVAGSLIGIFLGLKFPSLGKPFGELSHMFLNLLQLCLLPIIVTSIGLSVAHFMVVKAKISSLRVMTILMLTLFLCSVIGSGAAYLTSPGKDLDFSGSADLKERIENSSRHAKSLNDPVESKLEQGILDIVVGAIPSNMFESLTANRLLQIVFFSMILGIGLGKFAASESELMKVTKQVRVVFYDLFEWFLTFFPIVLVFLLTYEVSQVGYEPLLAMGRFIGIFYLLSMVVILLSLMIIKSNTRATWRQTLSIMFNPVLIALATQNSNNTIPPSIFALRRFNFNVDLTQLLVPLGSIIGRYGFIIYFGFIIVFALQVYGVDLSLTQYILVSFIITMASLASAGQDELTITMGFLLVILTPIGIPLEGVLPLLFAIDLFIDPLRTALTVAINCAVVTTTDSPQGPLLSEAEVEKLQLNPVR